MGIIYLLDDNDKTELQRQITNISNDVENMKENGAGKPGNDGFSPTINVEEIDNGHHITIVDIHGEKSFDIKNGEDGIVGKDGKSIVITNIEESLEDSGNNIITFSDGTVLTVKNGSAGQNGANGNDGANGVDGVGIQTITQTITSNEDDGLNVFKITLTNNQSFDFSVKNGSKGSIGENGFSPSARVITTSTGAVIEVTDKSGTSTSRISHGKDGISAYQVWLNQGNTGTEEDFLNSISNKEQVDNLDEKIQKNINDISAIKTDVGNTDNLQTSNKDIVGAINEALAAIGSGGTASVITITTNTTSEGALKSYTIKQGSTVIGTIDIPKDMVVKSGSVVVNPEGQEAGTYIKLILANVVDPLYINVGTLVDIYKAKADATQIQLTIDSSTREISAVIVAGSVGTTELANNAIVTAKIADSNVTLPKLSSAVQTSLGKADTAVQKVKEGSTNGTIAVDGTSVAVHGLGSAAYTNSDAYDKYGDAIKALNDAKEYTNQKDNEMNIRVEALEADTLDVIYDETRNILAIHEKKYYR